jgi:hypothetical protein
MTQREKEIFDDLMDLYEFQVYKNDQGLLQVNDLQGACLGDICDEIFKDEWEILDRMNIYHNDYILNALEETFDEYLDFEEWVQFLKTQDENEFGYDLKVLELIVKAEKIRAIIEYQKIVLDNVSSL